MKTTLVRPAAALVSGLFLSTLLTLTANAGPGPQFQTGQSASRAQMKAPAAEHATPTGDRCTTTVTGHASFTNVSGKIAPTNTPTVHLHTCPVCAMSTKSAAKMTAATPGNCPGCTMAPDRTRTS